MQNNNNFNIFKLNEKNINKRIIRDIFFINGCVPNILRHSYRYRVLHQMEQLNEGNLLSLDSYYLNIDPLIVRDFLFIILYCCPWTKHVEEAITLA